MRSTGKSFVVTLLITLSAFLSVAYTACNKTEVTPSEDLCKSITCQNGGTCFKGKCSCPGGFEGTYCETRAINKFTGTWKLTEKITGSTIAANIGTEKTYSVTISTAQGSNVDFFINNFMGNDGYDNVPCRMGTNAKMETASYNYFGFLQSTVASSIYVITSGEGAVNNFGTFINGNYIRSYPDTLGAVTDSVSITMER